MWINKWGDGKSFNKVIIKNGKITNFYLKLRCIWWWAWNIIKRSRSQEIVKQFYSRIKSTLIKTLIIINFIRFASLDRGESLIKNIDKKWWYK